MSDQHIYQLSESVIRLASMHGLTIATAESCTGGWIGKSLTDIPGSSKVFMGGLVAYSNEIKENLLGVSNDLLQSEGAVSAPVAHEMAKHCLQKFDVSLAISVTGIAGPGGGTDHKPVGLVFMGLATQKEVITREFRFDNFGRDSIRKDALLSALELLKQGINVIQTH